jgi:hypothetical protein
MEFHQGEEVDLLFALSNANDGRHELEKEARDFQQRWEEVVEEIDQETFNVRTVMILERSLSSFFSPQG